MTLLRAGGLLPGGGYSALDTGGDLRQTEIDG